MDCVIVPQHLSHESSAGRTWRLTLPPSKLLPACERCIAFAKLVILLLRYDNMSSVRDQASRIGNILTS